uniref:CSON003621 protein n=1 Tax=Culicoides sonorensis TaxID=179676 RepID=A0A336MNW8_CULSO
MNESNKDKEISVNQISWIRRRDWHILSSGSQLYTNDERFGILHQPGSNVWTLQIKYVQQRDSGMYECQRKRILHDIDSE